MVNGFTGSSRMKTIMHSRLLRMSSFGDDFVSKPKPPVDADASPAPAPTIVPVTDSADADEEPVPEKAAPVPTYDEPEISNSMKEKLRGELQAQGAYANKKSANPILIISGVVALLVLLGGQGFFF